TGEYTFVPNSNAINALSSNVTDTFTFIVSDGSGSSDSKVLTINIESVNDAPLLGGSASSPTFTENGAATLIDKTITITDLEGTSYDSGYVAFKISQNAQVEDKLSILNVGGISLSGNNVTYGGVIIGVVDSTYNGQNGKELRVNLNSNAYSSQVQALARAIAFSNPTDDLSSNARTIEIKVSDGGNGGETTARYSTKEAVVNIQTINDLPQISLGNESLIVEKSIVSNPNGMLPLGSMINFADLDGDILTVRIETTNYGSININDSILNGVNASSISGNNSRVVTLTGTIEQINTTLNASNGIIYTAGFGNDFITPGADYLKVTATDDLGGVSTSQKLVMVLPAIPNAQSDNIIGKEDNDILIDIDSLILDVNDTNINYIFGTGTPDITDINGTVITAGTITAFDSSKYIYADYDINGDGNIDSTDISKVIGFELTNGKLIFNNDRNLVDDRDFAQFTFIPNENWSGVETFLYKFSSDQKTSNIAQIAIFVTPVNDAPVVSIGNSSITINEDNSFVFNNTNAINLADIDAVDSTQILDLTLRVNEGKLELSQLSGLTVLEGANNTSIIKVQGTLTDLQTAINNLKYTPNQDYNGSDSLTIKLNDKSNVGEGNILEDEKTINITINALNDAPVFTNQSENTVEGNTITGVLPASDVDSASISFSVNGTAPTGFILNNDGSYSFDSSSYDYIGEGETDTIIIPINVRDAEGLVTTATFSITITGTNDVPTVSFENIDSKIPFGEVYNKDISSLFSDKDLTDNFRFEATNLPLGLTINPNTGIISGRVAQSGNFVIVIKGIDSQGASVTRTYNMLVIAPAQIAEPTNPTTPTIPTNSDTNTNNSTDGLNNFTDNNSSNLGVLNFNSNDGLSVDTGIGFLGTEVSQNNPTDGTNDNTPTTNTSNPNDSKGVLQASVDLNVLTNGQVVFNEGNQDSFSIVGITIEDIKVENNFMEIKVVDTNLSQNFIVTQTDGTPLPAGLFFDPKTGNITGTIPEDLEKIDISIKAINQDGTTRVLNLKLDLKELKNKNQANQADADEKYMGLKEQIAMENQKLDGYGSYLTRLFV
ncbi:MAG: beta strand repeat-containing protein, partial [Arcobacter sp.]